MSAFVRFRKTPHKGQRPPRPPLKDVGNWHCQTASGNLIGNLCRGPQFPPCCDGWIKSCSRPDGWQRNLRLGSTGCPAIGPIWFNRQCPQALAWQTGRMERNENTPPQSSGGASYDPFHVFIQPEEDLNWLQLIDWSRCAKCTGPLLTEDKYNYLVLDLARPEALFPFRSFSQFKAVGTTVSAARDVCGTSDSANVGASGAEIKFDSLQKRTVANTVICEDRRCPSNKGKSSSNQSHDKYQPRHARKLTALSIADRRPLHVSKFQPVSFKDIFPPQKDLLENQDPFGPPGSASGYQPQIRNNLHDRLAARSTESCGSRQHDPSECRCSYAIASKDTCAHNIKADTSSGRLNSENFGDSHDYSVLWTQASGGKHKSPKPSQDRVQHEYSTTQPTECQAGHRVRTPSSKPVEMTSGEIGSAGCGERFSTKLDCSSEGSPCCAHCAHDSKSEAARRREDERAIFKTTGLGKSRRSCTQQDAAIYSEAMHNGHPYENYEENLDREATFSKYGREAGWTPLAPCRGLRRDMAVRTHPRRPCQMLSSAGYVNPSSLSGWGLTVGPVDQATGTTASRPPLPPGCCRQNWLLNKLSAGCCDFNGFGRCADSSRAAARVMVAPMSQINNTDERSRIK